MQKILNILSLFVTVLFHSCLGGKFNSDLSNFRSQDNTEVLNVLHRSVRSLFGFGLDDPPDSWTGRWFPDKAPLSRHRPSPDSPPSPWSMLPYKEQQHVSDIQAMKYQGCDNGKINLTLDWDGSYNDFLCLHPPDERMIPDPNLPSIEKEHFIPKKYVTIHVCMDKRIAYLPGLLTYGPHRPVWPNYGEYKYVPPQRWLHSLEHGGIVMVYHPCAHPFLVNKLKKLVKSCLFRHVITPWNALPPERPLALLAWGWSLSMSDVNSEHVVNFIKKHALHGTERIPYDGGFTDQLLFPARLVSDEEDSRLCPNLKF